MYPSLESTWLNQKNGQKTRRQFKSIQTTAQSSKDIETSSWLLCQRRVISISFSVKFNTTTKCYSIVREYDRRCFCAVMDFIYVPNQPQLLGLSGGCESTRPRNINEARSIRLNWAEKLSKWRTIWFSRFAKSKITSLSCNCSHSIVIFYSKFIANFRQHLLEIFLHFNSCDNNDCGMYNL